MNSIIAFAIIAGACLAAAARGAKVDRAADSHMVSRLEQTAMDAAAPRFSDCLSGLSLRDDYDRRLEDAERASF
jgi:hypothetical protein